jgi:anti-anti-sigma factor
VPLLNVALVPAPDQVVVRLTGDVDLSTAPLLTDALGQAAGIGTPHLVVDIAAARFWDSSGLRALTSFTADMRAAGRSCRLVGAGPATRRLIAAAGLEDRLDLAGPVPSQPGPPLPAPRPARHPAAAERAAPPPYRRGGPGSAGRSPVTAAAQRRWV